MKLTNTLAIAVFVASGTSAMAGAVVDLQPSEISGTLTGINNIEFPEIIGDLVQDNHHDFQIHAGGARGSELLYEGTLMTRVGRRHDTNELVFYYMLSDPNAALADQDANIEISGFGNHQTLVEYRNDAGAPGDGGPMVASRDATGDILDFSFGNELTTAEESNFFFAMLDTTEFYENTGSATIHLTTGESVSFSIIGTSPVPAPGALGLLSAAGLMTVRRRR